MGSGGLTRGKWRADSWEVAGWRAWEVAGWRAWEVEGPAETASVSSALR